MWLKASFKKNLKKGNKYSKKLFLTFEYFCIFEVFEHKVFFFISIEKKQFALLEKISCQKQYHIGKIRQNNNNIENLRMMMMITKT